MALSSSKAAGVLSGLAAGHACCLFSISCRKEAQVLTLSFPIALIQSGFFSAFLQCLFALGGGGWDWKVSLCRDSYEQDSSTNLMYVCVKHAAAIHVDYVLVLVFFQLCSVKKIQEAQCVSGAQCLPEPVLSAPLSSLHCPH